MISKTKTKSERREDKATSKKKKQPKHGYTLASTYRNAIEKRINSCPNKK